MNSRIAPKQWFCLFRGEAGPMAVAVEYVAAILETDTLVHLAWSPPQVAGLCSYHREVVPVVKLSHHPHGAADDPSRGRDQIVVTDTIGEKTGVDEPTGCIVLILRTEHGAWGLRIERENTSMSQESPEYQASTMSANGPVLIGIVRLAGTCYAILDAEATWHDLRCAIAAWCGQTSDSNPSSPLPLEEDPLAAGRGFSGQPAEA